MIKSYWYFICFSLQFTISAIVYHNTLRDLIVVELRITAIILDLKKK